MSHAFAQYREIARIATSKGYKIATWSPGISFTSDGDGDSGSWIVRLTLVEGPNCGAEYPENIDELYDALHGLKDWAENLSHYDEWRKGQLVAQLRALAKDYEELAGVEFAATLRETAERLASNILR